MCYAIAIAMKSTVGHRSSCLNIILLHSFFLLEAIQLLSKANRIGCFVSYACRPRKSSQLLIDMLLLVLSALWLVGILFDGSLFLITGFTAKRGVFKLIVNLLDLG